MVIQKRSERQNVCQKSRALVVILHCAETVVALINFTVACFVVSVELDQTFSGW